MGFLMKHPHAEIYSQRALNPFLGKHLYVHCFSGLPKLSMPWSSDLPGS